MKEQDTSVTEQPSQNLGRARRFLRHLPVALFSLYATAAIAAGAYVRFRLWDSRTLLSNPVDYSWQLSLPWHASHGQWVGRDFHFPMGPLWQALAYFGALPGAFDAAHAAAGMQAVVQALGVILSFVIAWRSTKHPLARLLVYGLLGLLCYGAGVATLRPMLSLAHVLLYLPSESSERRPTARDAVLAAGVATVAALLSLDRLVLAGGTVGLMACVELLLRWRHGLPLRPGLRRFALYLVAQAGWLAGVCAIGLGLGVSPTEYVAEQRAMAASYAVTLAKTAEDNAANVILLVVCACMVALFGVASRERRALEACWIAGALPLAVFAIPQPNAGHVFMGVLPLVGVLIVIAARPSAGTTKTRSATALLAAIFLLGWYGARSENLWLSPKVFAEASKVRRGERKPQLDFATDISTTTAFLRDKKRTLDGACVSLSPGLSVAHALADLPGPTSIALRWNSEQQRRLGQRIREERCPTFVYQIGSFDRPDQPNWFLGEDLFVISELYEVERRLGPATFAMRLRQVPLPPKRQSLPLAEVGRTTTVSVPGELVLSLGRELTGPDFLWLDHSFEIQELTRMLGASPEIFYRFERDGKAVSAEVPWTDVAINTRTKATLAVDPVDAEWRWIVARARKEPARADSVRLRFAPRGRLSPSEIEFVVHAAEAWSPRTKVVTPRKAHCTPKADLLESVQSGAAMPRGVAVRPTEQRFLLHPTPKPEQPAEVYFPVRPCGSTCLYMELGIEMPKGSGDGALAEVHVHDADQRPVIFRQVVLPGEQAHKIELPLDRWKDRDVLLRLGSETRDSPANDFLFVGKPRLNRCSNRAVVAEKLRRRLVRVPKGWARPEGPSYVAMSPNAALSYPFYVSADTCVRAQPKLEGGESTRLELAVWVEVDGRRHRLYRETLSASQDPPDLIFSLHDWFRRHLALSLETRVIAGSKDARLLLQNFSVGSCPQN